MWKIEPTSDYFLPLISAGFDHSSSRYTSDGASSVLASLLYTGNITLTFRTSAWSTGTHAHETEQLLDLPTQDSANISVIPTDEKSTLLPKRFLASYFAHKRACEEQRKCCRLR